MKVRRYAVKLCVICVFWVGRAILRHTGLGAKNAQRKLSILRRKQLHLRLKKEMMLAVKKEMHRKDVIQLDHQRGIKCKK